MANKEITVNARHQLTFTELQHQVWETVDKNGFHEDDDKIKAAYMIECDCIPDDVNDCLVFASRTRIMERLMMVVSEVGEACDAVRANDVTNLAEELADIVMRVMDCAQQWGIDLESEIIKKDKINQGRGHMHGGKSC